MYACHAMQPHDATPYRAQRADLLSNRVTPLTGVPE
jgi:hypothetical protein